MKNLNNWLQNDPNTLKTQIIRFLLTGGLNTAGTVLIYQILVTFWSPTLSYAISWIIGFLFVMIAYPTYVFQTKAITLQKVVAMAFAYLCSFFLGVGLTFFFVSAGLHERIVILIVLCGSTVVNFCFGRIIFSITSKRIL